LRVFLVMLFFIGCEKPEDDKLYHAQICLDQATASTVDSCLTILSGMTSDDAYSLLCSGNLLQNGISEKKILDVMKGTTDGSGGTLDVLGALTLQSKEKADAVFNSCSNSSDGLNKMLATFTKMATSMLGKNADLLKKIKDGDSITADEIQTTIDSLDANDADTQESVGQAVLASYNDVCKGASNPLCTEMDTAVASGASNQDIGKSMIIRLQTQTSTFVDDLLKLVIPDIA
jgi:hypothetical protein